LQILCVQIKIIDKYRDTYRGVIMSFEQLQLKNQLCHRLYMASNSIARAYRTPLAAINLTYPQYLVMMALWEKDQITIAELIEKTAIDGSALTQILKKMADKELLAVVKDEQDKRKRHIQLTDGGQALKLKASHIPSEIRCKFDSIDATRSLQLMQALDLIVNDLKNDS